MPHWLDALLASAGISWKMTPDSDRLIAVALSLLLSYLVTLAAKKWLVPILHRFVEHTSSTWDHLLLNRKVLRAACNLLPPLILLYTIPIFSSDGLLPHWVKTACLIYLVITILLLANSLVDAVHDIWNTFENLRDKPIRGYLQVFKILFFIIAGIIIVSILLDSSPLAWLTGIGASAAILSLAFKDTIMGFIASIQLSANDMVRKGDWITIPKHAINGIVEDITLNTVKVKNFDATMITIPTYSLISDSFQNWRTMKEGGARRVMKSFFIDTQTVRFYTWEEARKLPGYALIADDPSLETGEEWIVNLTLLRIYLKRYLDNHPLVPNELLCVIRELQHSPEGIPLELLFFISDTEWPRYENIQANILDHITAVVSQFGLRIFQHPSGYDVDQIAASFTSLQKEIRSKGKP